jgi:hypothetical protein
VVFMQLVIVWHDAEMLANAESSAQQLQHGCYEKASGSRDAKLLHLGFQRLPGHAKPNGGSIRS